MKKESQIRRIKEILAPLTERPVMAVAMVFLSMFYEVMWVVIVELFRRLIHSVERWDGIDAMYDVGWWIVWCVLLVLIVNVATYKIFWYKLVVWVERFLAKKYVTKYIFMDNEEVVKHGVGKIIPLITGWFHDWSEVMFRFILDMIRTIFGFAIFMVYIAWIDPSLLWIVIAYAAFSVLWIFFVNRQVLELRRKRHETYDDATSYIVKMLMEKFTILKNNKIDQEQRRLRKLYDISEVWWVKADFWLMLIHSMPEAFISVFKLIVILTMWAAAYAGDNTFADIAVVMMVVGMMHGKIAEFNDNFKMITLRLDRVNRIIDLFDRIPQIKGYEDGPDYVYTGGEIILDNVTFAYKKSAPVFQDFSMKIRWWQKVALVGKSGVGKSTLIKLILGFADPREWQVLVDGQCIEDFNLKSYYRHIGYLSQEPSVFDGSIRENLIYGLDDEDGLDQDKLWEAVDHAQCWFIRNFEEGLETQIGEKGIRLSGWERQRLAIARLFLQNPNIVILDEPTSALDSFSEVKISQALHHLCDWKTLIVIAHRLQTVKDADVIFVIGPNSIIEKGSHDELLSDGGEYAGMVDLQSGLIRE